jgi:D-2-hydroxyglutarate dehydrogenase
MQDNTGYDLKQLLIGSEGTLAVITKVAIATPRRATSVNVALLACADFASVTRLLALAKLQLGEVLSAVELMDTASVQLTVQRCAQLQLPLVPPQGTAFIVLIESSGVCAEHDSAKMAALLEAAFDQGVAHDGVIAQVPLRNCTLPIAIAIAVVTEAVVHPLSSATAGANICALYCM